ncbi:MAG: CsbD family protein [Cyanobacteria bacterium J06614_10]
MSLEEKAKATAKDLEGKAQEAVGKATDNTEAQAKGEAKQAQASATKAKENVKDGIKDAID